MEPFVHDQLRKLNLDPHRPLIVTDADEVLTYFISGLERFLSRNGYWLDLKNFAITGNIRKQGSNEVSSREQVQGLLADFFITDTELLDPVDGAADALNALARRAQIIVLSNVPLEAQDARQRWLRKHGMDFPLVANAGSKGLPLRYLSQQIVAPMFFLDDLPPHIDAVAEHASQVWRLHFIADKRLASFASPAQNSHFHTSHWPDAHNFIGGKLEESGY
jgi:hypothetical protein